MSKRPLDRDDILGDRTNLSRGGLASGDLQNGNWQETHAVKLLVAQDDDSIKLMQQLQREKENMMIDVVSLTGDVTRLHNELAAATKERKKSMGMVKSLLEKCSLLEYERDGLRSEIKESNEEKKKMEHEITYLKETTNLLVDKINWHKANSSSDQKIRQEDREKNKEDQKLKDRITVLEMLLSKAEEDKKGALELLKAAETESERLNDNNIKLAEELKYSLDARQKQYTNLDELEESTKEFQSRQDKYQEGLKSAKEYVVALKKEKEDISSELKMKEEELKEMGESMKELRGRFNAYEDGLDIVSVYYPETFKGWLNESSLFSTKTKEYIKSLENEKEEMINELKKRDDEIKEIKSIVHQSLVVPSLSHFPNDNPLNPRLLDPTFLPPHNSFTNSPQLQKIPSLITSFPCPPFRMNTQQRSRLPTNHFFFP